MARKPCHDIRNVLGRHGSALDVTAPVRCTQFRPACNHDRSKLLITCQSKVRTIYDRAGRTPSTAADSMTGGTVRAICIGATLRIARSLRCIRRRNLIAESTELRPGSDSSHKGVDLLVGEHSTPTLRKGGHRSAGNSACRGAANHRVVGNSEKNWIGQGDGCSAFAVGAMASRTVLAVKETEVRDLIGRNKS